MRSIFVIVLFAFYSILNGQERPNILWLVTEDMSPYLGSYGNNLVDTPNLDTLAAKGIRFTQAHSNGAMCSPARSTLISGIYATSLGTDIHRESRPVPDSFYFPIYLREAGYFCTNFAKEDYNNLRTPTNVWDESKPKASYIDRPDKSQPFFSVFNNHLTHMNRVATRTVEGRSPRNVDMNRVNVPAYIPDLPDVRNDIAWNMDAVMLMDKWVGEHLQDLKNSGEADNTIIFFFSDHGGTVPRGKSHLYESGTLVPLIVYFPRKWKHLANELQPKVENRLVSFVDFAPTILNLAGIKIPDFMVGKPFFGPDANIPENIRKYTFSFRSNLTITFAPTRAVSDGHYKLIWNYQSVYPNGARQEYQWQMPAQQAWDVANINNNLNSIQKSFWLPPETFELYDLTKDSSETINLISDRAYNTVFMQLKKILQDHARNQVDLGFIPMYYRRTLQNQGPLYNLMHLNNFEVSKQIEAAEIASIQDTSNAAILIGFLSEKDPVVQYWGMSGICGLAKAGLIKSIPPEIIRILDDTSTILEVKCLLAEAMVYTGNDAEGLAFLLKELKVEYWPAVASLQNVGAQVKPITGDLWKILNSNKKGKEKLNFFIRSMLINAGEMPYSNLFKVKNND